MGRLIEVGRFDPDEVLPYTMLPHPTQRSYPIGNGVTCSINMRSLQYDTFNKSLKCVCCGIEGTVMILEYSQPGRNVPPQFAAFQRPHFNLYAVMPNGGLRLMTKDHILPASKGGPDHVDNLQTMCSRCNRLKGSDEISLEELRKRAETPDPVKYSERHKPCRFVPWNRQDVTLAITRRRMVIHVPMLFSKIGRRNLRFFARYISLMIGYVTSTIEGTFFEDGIFMMPQDRQCAGKYIFFSWEEMKAGYYLMTKPVVVEKELEKEIDGVIV